jgi:hypothetical protein
VKIILLSSGLQWCVVRKVVKQPDASIVSAEPINLLKPGGNFTYHQV